MLVNMLTSAIVISFVINLLNEYIDLHIQFIYPSNLVKAEKLCLPVLWQKYYFGGKILMGKCKM